MPLVPGQVPSTRISGGFFNIFCWNCGWLDFILRKEKEGEIERNFIIIDISYPGDLEQTHHEAVDHH